MVFGCQEKTFPIDWRVREKTVFEFDVLTSNPIVPAFVFSFCFAIVDSL
jgi:hypothetical protein